MQLAFRTRKLERCYLQQREATREWGPNVGRRYIKTLTELQLLTRFGDISRIRPYRLHQLTGKRKGQFAIDLHGRWRLIVKPTADEDGLTVWEVSNHYGD